jgi:hypothetical protein
MTPSHKVCLTLSLRDPVERIKTAFAKLGVEAHVKEYPTYRRVTAYSADLANKFAEWFGMSSDTKRFPPWLVHGRHAADAVAGLLQADGCEYKGRRIVQTVSDVLAHQLRLLLAALGERPATYRKKPGKGSYANGREAWVVEWRPGAKRGGVRNDAGFVMHKVTSVLLTPYEGQVFNYEVEVDHSYVADGVAVHNCMALVGMCGGSRPGGFILNSWGGNAHTGPIGKGGHSPAGFWAEDDVVDQMLKQDDSWAFSAFQGFPARELSWLI